MEHNAKEYEKAISYIRQQLSQGDLQIGSRLPTERVIAQTLGISRNSTREALRTMENMGVTESKQGSGSYLSGDISKKVSDMIEMMLLMGKTTLVEICDFRRSMEKTVCDMILKNPSADDYLPQIREVLDSFMSTPLDGQIELDRKFHFLLIHATENKFLIMLMDAISDTYRRIINIVLQNASEETKGKIHQFHYAIYNSLLLRNQSLCMAAIDEHYDLIEEEQQMQNLI